VTSCPRKKTLPPSARSSPDKTFKSVDLPAPLGPMIACTLFRSKAMDAPLDQPRHAARQEEHHQDHHRADQGVVMIGGAGAVVFQKRQQEGAEDRAVERAPAAQQHHHQEQARLAPTQLGRIDEAVERRVEIARDARDRSGDDEGHQLVAAGGEAERPGALLVAVDPSEHAAEGRAQEALQQEVRQHQRGEDEEIGGGPIGEVEQRLAEEREQRLLREVESVGAAEPGRLAEEIEEHLREGERHHDEVDAGRAQAQPADAERGEGGAEQRERQREERVDQLEAIGQPDQRIGREAEEGRVRQAHQPGVADQQIEADGEDAGDHRLAEELHPEAIADPGDGEQREGAREEDRLDAPRLVHRASAGTPKSPRGRQMSTAAITA